MPSPLRKESLSGFVSRMMAPAKPAPKQRTGYSDFKRQKKKA